MTTYQPVPPPGWSPQPWAGLQPEPPRPPAPPPSRLPVVAVVLASLALVLALAAGLAVLFGGGGGGDGPLTGQLSEVRAGSRVAGGDLEKEVTEVIENDGGDVDQMTCPDTPALNQGVVTVCHGQIEGSDYAVVVFFEDATGRLTLLPT